MTVCTECLTIEPKIVEYVLNGDTYDGCGACGCQEESLVNYNEDEGMDR